MATVNVYSPDDVIALGACKYWDVDIATSKNIGSRKWAGNQSHNMCKKDALKIDFWNIMCLLTSFIIGHFLALLSFPSNFYEWIYCQARSSSLWNHQNHQNLSTSQFFVGQTFLLVILDINVMLILFGQYLPSFVNVLVLMSMYVIRCLMFNEDFVNSHWFSGDHPIPFVLNVRDKYYQSMMKTADPQGFS